ncbi:F-box/FBD/LRR-repeat protein At1g13570 isoform X1 [Triticum aestivum]|uniref:F-box domain-containing protein n=1 Tax=Triticum aestivum TaxID=4565 RepID=A0A3B6I1N6_WHEAT|nr:F-box/FBD/LRR-repeat protein At1g13570-like isoform X1 [Triticum aestivum]XP_044365475.1 F-box/FBD/LRR-repeat protein At1g13570-like isoform X1 [Triticum aestivum]
MGNMLTVMLGTTAVVDHCHPRQLHPGGSSRIAGHQFEPLSILAFRAISEHIGRSEAFCRKQILNGRFQLLTILVCGAIRSEGITANDPFKLCGILICGVLSDYISHDAEEPATDLLGDLPEFGMGNILNFTTTVADHCHPRQLRIGSGTVSRQLEPLSILAFRALCKHIQQHEAFHRKRIANGQFQLLSILLCGVIHAKGIIGNDRCKLCCILICGVISDYIHHGPIDAHESAIDLFGDLPEALRQNLGVLCTIFSKLSLKEAVRTSAVSRKWRYLWTVCPKLSFDGSTICGNNRYGKQVYALAFIRIVNRVLAQCRGKLFEELAIKIDLNRMFVEHLNNWVRFAVSSSAKTLVFDLAPQEHQLPGRDGQYKFPFELLDKDSVHRLQKIHLSFVDFQPPMQFSGFPNLRKLDLNLVNVNGKDIPHMLSNCCNLEWLSMVRCHLNGELKVNGPLPHLLHLKLVYCDVTSIAFDTVNLATFIYKGRKVPIDLNKSLELVCADIWFSTVTFERAITLLGKVLKNVQHLTLDMDCKPPEIPRLMHYRCMFSKMTYLQLRLVYVEGLDVLSLVSFLRSAPFIEKLELHFCFPGYIHLVQEPESIRKLPECLFNNLKSLHVTGFKACTGQVEFLMHMVENAPALEGLTIDQSEKYLLEGHKKDAKTVIDLVHRTAKKYLEGKISPRCILMLL